MSMPDNPDDAPEPTLFERLQGSLPPGLKAALEAQMAQYAQAQEMGRIDMGMQVTGLHTSFEMLTTPPGPDRFNESQALYYLAKIGPGV